MQPFSSSAFWISLAHPEEIAAAVPGADVKFCRLKKDAGRSSLLSVTSPRCRLGVFCIGTPLLIDGMMPRDCFTITFVLHTPEKARSFNYSTDYTDGYLGFFPPGAAVDVALPANYRDLALTIAPGDFHALLGMHFPEMPQRVLERGAGLWLDAGEQRRLRRMVRLLEEAVADPRQPLAHPAALAQCEAELLDLALGALRQGCDRLVPEASPRQAAKLRRLREARSWLEHHPGEPVYMESLCQAVGLGVRAMEFLFREQLGITPTAYLRHQRLHAVRRQLQTSTPGPGLIKETALHWGFWHLGHFARDYRHLFGELPRQTVLARSR